MQVVEVPLGAGRGRRLCDRRRGPGAGARRARPLRPRPARHARPAVGRRRPVRPRPQPDLLQPAVRAAVLADRRFPRRPARVRPGDRRDARGRQSARGARLPGLEGGASRAGSPPAWPRTRRTGCCPAASICASSPSRCPTAACCIIFEDRTEQIQLASARDTLLRVRTATFDNLFEAVGVFASDGRLNLWNNRFRELWGLDEEQLAAHPRVDALTPLLAAEAQARQPCRPGPRAGAQRHGRAQAALGPGLAASTAASSSSPRCRCPTATRCSPCSTSPTAGRSRRRCASATRRSRRPTG